MSAENVERNAGIDNAPMTATEGSPPGEAASPEDAKESTLRELLDTLVTAVKATSTVGSLAADIRSYQDVLGAILPEPYVKAEKELSASEESMESGVELIIKLIVDRFGEGNPVPDQG